MTAGEASAVPRATPVAQSAGEKRNPNWMSRSVCSPTPTYPCDSNLDLALAMFSASRLVSSLSGERDRPCSVDDLFHYPRCTDDDRALAQVLLGDPAWLRARSAEPDLPAAS